MGNDATEKPAEKPKARPGKPAVAAKAATPWGSATVVEEVKVSQRVGDRRFASIVQLLEDSRGAPLVRIAYTTDGITRRGPVTLRPRDLEKLRSALEPGSALAAAFGWTAAERGPAATDDAGGEA
jgi:hypothetical protein